ncbi:MAG TPA: glycosyltransferase family 4 protein [Candidatus Acidoferrales bacterium]|nr:glycosyltransferase family 4 protein [Candidatus Acidoferrales bacterium]
MRILHLDAGSEMRGGQWQALRLIEGLAAAGWESTLLARPEGALFGAVRRLGYRVQPLGLAHAVALLRHHDLIHAHDARSHSLGLFLRGKPLVVSRRVAFPVGSRWKYGRASRYLAVSEFVKGVLQRGGVAEEKIAVVYDGVPLLDPAHGENVVLLHKGGHLEGGATIGQLSRVPIKPCGRLEDDLREAAMLVYITDSEGLGSGALLAMSAAVPVIASRVGGLMEVITHGENGLLVDNDAAAFAAAIRELMADPDRRARIGAAARRTVLERFTVDNMVRRTMEAYHQVLA